MDIKILEESKNKIIFELPGQSHTFSNALRKELWNDDHVKIAAYTIEHPQVGQPRFILETDGEDPKKTLKSAAKRVIKVLEKVKEDAKKAK